MKKIHPSYLKNIKDVPKGVWLEIYSNSGRRVGSGSDKKENWKLYLRGENNWFMAREREVSSHYNDTNRRYCVLYQRPRKLETPMSEHFFFRKFVF